MVIWHRATKRHARSRLQDIVPVDIRTSSSIALPKFSKLARGVIWSPWAIFPNRLTPRTANTKKTRTPSATTFIIVGTLSTSVFKMTCRPLNSLQAEQSVYETHLCFNMYFSMERRHSGRKVCHAMPQITSLEVGVKQPVLGFILLAGFALKFCGQLLLFDSFKKWFTRGNPPWSCWLIAGWKG